MSEIPDSDPAPGRSPNEPFLRQRKVWVAFLLVAYGSSSIWLGKVIFTNAPAVILLMPLGLVAVLTALGFALGPETGNAMPFVGVAHVVFWPVLAWFLWQLPRLPRPVFYSLAAIISLIVLTTWSGCVFLIHR